MKKDYIKKIEESIVVMKEQKDLYIPSSFWWDASLEIKEEIIESGINKFRSLKTNLDYFVPTYGFPGNCFTSDFIDNLKVTAEKFVETNSKPNIALNQFIDGYNQAFSDYRVFVASDKQDQLPYLQNFSESNFGDPIEQFTFDEKKFSRSSLNYLLGLTFLKNHLKNEQISKVLEIGGGFGTLGEILYSSGIENLKYIDLDIPPVANIAFEYLKNLDEQNSKFIIDTKEEKIPIDELKKTNVLCSWNIEKLEGEIDLFVNFISFQEMEPFIVENYLFHVDRLKSKWILLRNMREGKNVKKNKDDVGVLVPILKKDYEDMLPNYTLIEANVCPFGFKTVDGFHSELMLFKRNSN